MVIVALILGYGEWRDWHSYLLLIMFVVNMVEILGDIKRQKQEQRQKQQQMLRHQRERERERVQSQYRYWE